MRIAIVNRTLYFSLAITLALSSIFYTFFIKNEATNAKAPTACEIISGDGTKIGDELVCNGEHFYVIENDGEHTRALAKYNLLAGYNAVDVSQNADFQHVRVDHSASSWSESEWNKVVYSHGYYSCTYDTTIVSEEPLIHEFNGKTCFEPNDMEVIFDDYSNQSTVNLPDEEWQKYQNGGCEWALVNETRSIDYCYGFNIKQNVAKQSSIATGSTKDINGKIIYPVIGNYYFNFGLPVPRNDGSDYLTMGTERARYNSNNELIPETTIGTNEIYYYVNNYGDYLYETGVPLSDIKLLSYNDLAKILTTINKSGITFKENGYLCDGEQSNDEDRWNCNGNPWLWTYEDVEGDAYGSSSLKTYVPTEYSWLYSTTYWLNTAFWNKPVDGAADSERYFDDDGSFSTNVNYQFFINTSGKLCFNKGISFCNVPRIGAGIRPVITVANSGITVSTIDVGGTVTWIDDDNSYGIRPDKSIIKLYRNGVLIDQQDVVKTDNDNVWSFRFTGLPIYDENGNKYVYSVSQDDIDRYETTANNFDFVNRYSENTTPPNPNTADSVGLWPFLLGSSVALGVVVIGRKRR